jgi:AcrR family transcriptional regulator
MTHTETDTALRLTGVAARLFHSNGYAATGVARILRESDAGSGSLYHFFPTKEDLLRSVLSTYRTRLSREIFEPVRDRLIDPVERVFGVLAFYRRFLESSGCSLGCPIGNLAGELSDSHPGTRKLLGELFAAWRDGVLRLLEEARARLAPGTDLDALATLVLSVMEGAVMQARVDRSLEPFDRSVAMLRDYFERLQLDHPERKQKVGVRYGARRRSRS